jgi:hypothetical protein
MVALFIGSTCSIWHNILTTVLFRYSGMGNTPAITEKKQLLCCETHKKHTENTVKKFVKLTTPVC